MILYFNKAICGEKIKISSCVILFLVVTSCSTATRQRVNKIPLRPQISPVLESSSYMGLKRKVAISRFTNETRHGSSLLFGDDSNRVGKQAMDILSSRLTSTGKFLMVERNDLEFVRKERNRFNVKLDLIGADQLIVGSVSEFGRTTESEVGVFSRNKKQKVYAKVNVRLIDVTTGEIIFSAEGEGEALSEANTVFGVGSRAAYDDSLNDKALSSAISMLVSNLIENLMDKPWESRIIGKQERYYIIAGGKKQGIKKGDLFKVVRPGRTVKSPQTGVNMTLPGKAIGKLKVVKLSGKGKNEISFCKLTSGKIRKSLFNKLTIREMSSDN